MSSKLPPKDTPRRDLSHVAPSGKARMVDVSATQVTDRTARAEAWVTAGPQIASMLREMEGVAEERPCLEVGYRLLLFSEVAVESKEDPRVFLRASPASPHAMREQPAGEFGR